ncbi:MAG: DNA repair protein RecN [Alphaproteobacteria bacterium]|nr:DNA repair protein RecN [Alphaproteobacteria bacterium]
MLQSLSIRNVVLIDKLDLDFKSGLSVLTGETGAGKSILLDSVGLVLGNRAETSLIRHGEDKLAVAASFSLPKVDSPLWKIFEENELEVEDELIIKRTLSRDGKGKIFINDQPVSAKLLKEAGKYLVEIHGQFDNQGLLNPANHRDVLDAFGAYPFLLENTKAKFSAYRNARKARLEAEENILHAKDEEENLRHWVAELEKISPVEGEEDELGKRRLELMNAEKIIENLNYAYGTLTQGADVLSALRQAQSAIYKANDMVDGKYSDIIDALEQAMIEADEAVNQIENASSNVAVDTGELEEIESRLFALRGLARKHQVEIDALPRVLTELKQKLSNIEFGEEGLIKLRKEEDAAKLDYVKAANELSQARQQTAAKLDAAVMQELPPLKMEKAKFITQIAKQEESLWGEGGFDTVTFTVATNPNSPQGPINKIASGGELARFMLALKVNLAQSSSVETMIFDEVDAGVGGATAQAVGERLSRLAQGVQVLVVTHSPQVAAKGNNHFKVEKNTVDNVTTTNVRELPADGKCEEIARMLAGERISDEARAAAKVLLSA